MTDWLGKLERLIGYKFHNIKLLERSVTHRSWANEEIPAGDERKVRELQNESLEFVGDAVLGLVVAEQLFVCNPGSSEGDLTLMKHHLVSTETLARIAGEQGLGKFMRVGRGEEKSGGRRKQALLANTLEAVIGAVFFDGGYSEALAFVKRMYSEDLRTATPRNSIDYKTLLQETLQAEKLAAPTYQVVKTEGPPHNRIFTVEAKWHNGVVAASGNAIKSAEMKAASMVLRILEETVADEGTTEEKTAQNRSRDRNSISGSL